MGAQSECRVIASKHNKHKRFPTRSQEKFQNPLSDKSSHGNNNRPGCLVVKSKSEMRISRTREYCIVDSTQFEMPAAPGCLVPFAGHRYIHNHTHKYHDYMNVVIPKESGFVKEQMKMVVGDLENVLGELQSVVGDLQVLVKQIDIVTSKIDKEYKVDPNRNNINGPGSVLAIESPKEKPLRPKPLKEGPSQPFDLIRRQMSTDYAFHAPAHWGNKASVKFQNGKKEPIGNQCIRKSRVGCSSTPLQNKQHKNPSREGEKLCPPRMQLANSLYEQAKKAHEEMMKNKLHSNKTNVNDDLIIPAYDENRNECKTKVLNNSGRRGANNSLINGLAHNAEQRSCRESIAGNKCNQQAPCEEKSASDPSIIIPSPVSNQELEYSGVYERELDLKLELEFDDNLENYNGVDEGSTLELHNYTDYKLMQKIQPPNSLPAWRAYPPVGVSSVDLSTIESSDDLQITTPTESSSDVLNDNVGSSVESSKDNSPSAEIQTHWDKVDDKITFKGDSC